MKEQIELISTFLIENKNKKVATIQDELMAMLSELKPVVVASSNGRATNYILDENDNPVAIFCYYHKKWEPVAHCEYGKKKGTKTGLNTMCKEGVSKWTAMQKNKKNIDGTVLELLSSGKITIEQMADKKAELETEVSTIIDRDDELGFETAQEAIDFKVPITDELELTKEDMFV